MAMRCSYIVNDSWSLPSLSRSTETLPPVEPKYTTISDEEVGAIAHLVFFREGLFLIMVLFHSYIGDLQIQKLVVESGSRRYVEIQLFFHKFRRFCRLPS